MKIDARLLGYVKLLKGTSLVAGFVNEEKGIIEDKIVVLNEDWVADMTNGQIDVEITDKIIGTHPW